MRPSYCLLVLLLLVNYNLSAQPTLWGTDFNQFFNNVGKVFSLPLGSNAPTVQHQFQEILTRDARYSELTEGINGEYWGITYNSIFVYSIVTEKYQLVTPLTGLAPSLIPGTGSGALCKAINGKIYGITSGCVFEIDPVTRTIANKVSTPGITLYGKLLEHTVGKLIGSYNSSSGLPYGYIYEYDYVANTFTTKANLSASTGYDSYGSPIKAPNGKIFFLFHGGSGCISEYIPTTGVVIPRYGFFSGHPSLGKSPRGSLVIGPNGLLYGLASSGGPLLGHSGTLFSFDPNSYAFNMIHAFTNSIDGEFPRGNLTLAPNGFFYGFCFNGGSFGEGTLFSFNPNNNQVSKILDLNTATGSLTFTNNLTVASDGNMYGMFNTGGLIGLGYLYQFSPSVGTITPKVHFSLAENGENPSGKLFPAVNNKLYGTTVYGGPFDKGTLFEIDLTNYNKTKLIDFNSTNGARPYGGIMQASNGKLYGMTAEGGNSNHGVIYEYNYGNNTYSVVHHFNSFTGSKPNGELIEFNGKLWGLTLEGGINNLGVLFEFDPTTNILTKKIDFDNANCNKPYGSLTLSLNGIMYGLGSAASSSSCGGIFSYNPLTNAFSTLRAMDNIACCSPKGTLTIAPNGNLYGAAQWGTDGRIFEYNPSTNALTAVYSSMALRDVYTSLYLASNGRLYGLAGYSGSLFEYNYTLNTYSLVANIGHASYVYTPRLTETNFACVNATNPSVAIDSVAICPGDSVLLTLSSGNLNNANRWQWYLGGCSTTPVDTGASIYVRPITPTTYYVRAEGGCSVPSACDSVTVYFSTPAVATITYVGQTSFCQGDSVTLLAQPMTGNTYQWRRNNVPIAGATQQNFVAYTTGYYNVEIFNATCTLLSNYITVSVPCHFVNPPPISLRSSPHESTNSTNATELLFHLNASSTHVNVYSNLHTSDQVIEIFDVNGKCVRNTLLKNGNNNLEWLSNSNGIYFFKIKVGGEIVKKGKVPFYK